MNFREIGTALSGRTMAVSTLIDIYSDVIRAEKTHLKTIVDTRGFREAAGEVHKFDDQHRYWGESYFDCWEPDEIETTADGVRLGYSDRRPCGRGCCYDSVYDSLFIPAVLIDARADDDGEKYEEALRGFIEERARPVYEYIWEQARKEVAEEIAQAKAEEERDQAEFLRLKAKYGENQNGTDFQNP